MCQQEEEKKVDREVDEGSALVAVSQDLTDEDNCVQDTHIEEPATPSIQPESVPHVASDTEDVAGTSEGMHATTKNGVQPEDSSNQQATEGANTDNADSNVASISDSDKTQACKQKTNLTDSDKVADASLASGWDDSDSDEEQSPDNGAKVQSPDDGKAQTQSYVIPVVRVDGPEDDRMPIFNRARPVTPHSPGRRRADMYDRKPHEMPYFSSQLRQAWSALEYMDYSVARAGDRVEIVAIPQPKRHSESTGCEDPYEKPRAAPTPAKSKGHRRTNAVTNAEVPLRSTRSMLYEWHEKYTRKAEELKYYRKQLNRANGKLEEEKQRFQQAQSDAESKAKAKDLLHSEDLAALVEEANDACTQLRVSTDKYEDRLKLLQQKLDESLAAIKSIEQERDDARASLLTLQTSLEERTAALEATETLGREMQTSIDAEKSNMSEIEARNNELQAQLDDFLARDRGIDQKTAKLQSHLRQLSRQLDGTHDMIEKLQTQNADLERANRRLEHQIALRRISEARSEPWNKRRKAWRQEYAWTEEHKILKQRAEREDLARADYESAREYALDDLKLPEPNDAFEFYQKLAGRVVRVPKSAAKSAAQDTLTRKPTWLSIWRNSVSQSFSWYW
ncbi:hypothetical protein CB0940_07047 [Cercospora beticola]|uniref:Uncharacterized protein n=1 Tax=Cercospora beticola TaxID=122368 RepID=A0A2G5H9J0_CERBT|nr:hypothetical protein CB0940_07047 [Cercospora beticola]PIA89197.1 hypothetical protein CB0940_07047 [Cercospora beticola]WPB02971.1 hypothetical protein RHO25_007607 [Cercospora beticola]CAK1358329.1 unnamed protein product [Cercospora beticola]